MSISKEREKDLRALITTVTKDLKLEPGDLVMGKDLSPERPRTTTGILALDVALNGGLPLDQWIEIVGHESGGKTATAMQIVAAQQRIDPEWICLWVAAEGFEREFAEMHGVDTERMLIVEMNSMEEVFETVVKAMELRAADGFVIDSYPALVPTGEYEREMIEGQMPAVGARLFNQFFRKVQKASRRSMIHTDRHWIGIIVNQWRESIGVMFGDPRTTPGGKGKNYSYYIRLEVAREEWLDNGLTKRDKEIVGQTIRCKIFKNKSGPPQRICHYDFYFADHDGMKAGDIDLIKDVFNTAEALKVVTRKETGNAYFFNGEQIGGNRPATLRNLGKNPDLAEQIQKEVMALVSRKRLGVTEEEAQQAEELGGEGEEVDENPVPHPKRKKTVSRSKKS
ncbi:MAG: hypothetical protein ABR616_15750 [Dermatophilaceae bacterium]|nr:DNA recombination/repair protein RecA [Intrasporangiaceae bacterium]